MNATFTQAAAISTDVFNTAFAAIGISAFASTLLITTSFDMLFTNLSASLLALQLVSDQAFALMSTNSLALFTLAIASMGINLFVFSAALTASCLLIETCFSLTFSKISSTFGEKLIEMKDTLSKEFDNIKITCEVTSTDMTVPIMTAFALMQATATAAFLATQLAVSENMQVLSDTSKESTDKVSKGFIDSFDSSSKLLSGLSSILSITKNGKEIFDKFKKIIDATTAAQVAQTGAQVAQTGAQAAATPVSYASASGFLAVGAGVLLMGLGIALAVSAIVLLLTVLGASVASAASGIGALISSFKSPPKPDIQSNLQLGDIKQAASGGFPSMGQMFIAREAGPELVGTIGSRSAVVNNDQIVESVSAGVYRAVKAAMGQNGGGVIQLILDGSKVAEVVSDNVNAITRRTGRCPILV